jgi:hypothetical protein
MVMKIKELINELSKVENKNLEVYYYDTVVDCCPIAVAETIQVWYKIPLPFKKFNNRFCITRSVYRLDTSNIVEIFTVQTLIDELKKVKNKNLEVCTYDTKYRNSPIITIKKLPQDMKKASILKLMILNIKKFVCYI